MNVIIEGNTFEFISTYNPHIPSADGWKKQNRDVFKFCKIGQYKVFVKRFEKDIKSIGGYQFLLKIKNKRFENLPVIYDVISQIEDGKSVTYLFQEALEGHTLEEIMQSGVLKFNPEKFVKHIYNAMFSITQNGFWFTDFVEKNIFIGDNGNYYLIDLDSVAPLEILPNEDNAILSVVNKNYKISVCTYFYRDTLHYPFTYIAKNFRGDTLNFLQLLIYVAQIKYYLEKDLTVNFLDVNTRKSIPQFMLNANEALTYSVFKSCFQNTSNHQQILPLQLLEHYVKTVLFPINETLQIDFHNKLLVGTENARNKFIKYEKSKEEDVNDEKNKKIAKLLVAIQKNIADRNLAAAKKNFNLLRKIDPDSDEVAKLENLLRREEKTNTLNQSAYGNTINKVKPDQNNPPGTTGSKGVNKLSKPNVNQNTIKPAAESEQGVFGESGVLYFFFIVILIAILIIYNS